MWKGVNSDKINESEGYFDLANKLVTKIRILTYFIIKINEIYINLEPVPFFIFSVQWRA